MDLTTSEEADLLIYFTSLLTLRSSVFLLSSSSFSWSLEVTVMLSVIRVTCSSVDRSLCPAGLGSSVLRARTDTHC